MVFGNYIQVWFQFSTIEIQALVCVEGVLGEPSECFVSQVGKVGRAGVSDGLFCALREVLKVG